MPDGGEGDSGGKGGSGGKGVNRFAPYDYSKGKGKGKGKGKAKGKSGGGGSGKGHQELNKALKDGGVIGVGDVADGPDDMRTAADRGDCIVWEWCRGERASASMNGGGDGKRNRRKEEGVTIFVGAFDDEEETVVAVGETGSAGALPANEGLTTTAGASSDDGAAPAVVVDAAAAVAAAAEAGSGHGRWGSEMKQLQEMGFSDGAALLPLLDEHNGNVGAVIDASM